MQLQKPTVERKNETADTTWSLEGAPEQENRERWWIFIKDEREKQGKEPTPPYETP